MKRASLLSSTVSAPTHSRLRGATKSFAVRLVLISAVLAGLVTVSLLYVTRPTYAAACNSTGGGNWNNTGRWSCGHVPTSVDDISILTGHTITYDLASATILSLTTAGTGTLSFNSGASDSLTVTGAVTNGGTIQAANGPGNRIHTLNVGGDFTNNGTFTSVSADASDVLNVVLNGTAAQAVSGSSTTTFNSLTISNTAATVSASTNFNVNGTMSVGASATFSPGSTVVINNAANAGTISGSGTIQVTRTAATADYSNQYKFTTNTLSSMTVDYAGAGNQTINSNTVGSLTTSGSGTKTMSAATIVNNACTIGSGTTLDEAGFQMTLAGTSGSLVVNGTLDFTDSTGLIRSGASGTTTLTMAASGLIRTVDQDGLGPAANASLQTQTGVWTVTSISTNGTVEYNRNATSGQTVTDRDYNNLTITGSTQTKTWTLGGTHTVNGTVTLNASAPLTLSGAQTVNVKGDWSNSGTFTAGTSTINFNGAANQTIGGSSSTTFATLTISNTSSAPAGTNKVSLATDTTVSTALNVTSGVFDQGASSNLTTNTVTISAGATLQNLGTGDLSLSGGVSNAGTINYNANGNTCGDNDDILIRSSASPTQRLWTGLGTFSMTDVDVKDQAGTALITVTSGTNSGNNGVNWTFVGACPGAQTYTWVGPLAGVDSYTTPTNWSPTRLLSNVNDVLVIDGTTRPTPSISSVPTETIARLRLINGTNTTLTTSAANTLTIGGGTGTDLDIANSSRLTLSGSSPLTISLATGATGNVDAFMVVQGGAHRLLAADAGAVTFPSGSTFTTSTGFTGNAFGTTNAGSIIFASGSAYIHGAGSSPFGTVGGTAVVVFQSGSEADYLTATGFDANGRTYANLVIGKGDPSGIVVNVTQSGTGNFQFNNLAINSPAGGSSSSLEYVGSGASTVTIGGNITSVGAVAGTLADVFLTAGTNIIINGGAAVSFGNSVGNTRSIFFGSDATVNSGTNLSLSRLVQMGSSGTNILTDNGTITPNVSTTGYIVGGVRKPIVPSPYTFPVGTTSGYTPVDLANASGGGDLTVTPKPTVAPVVNAATSLKEHWTLSLNSGLLTTDMTFTYLQADVMGTESNYRIIRVDSGTAVSFPNNCPSPPGSACVDYATNNKATILAVSAFSDWTLGENVAPTAVRLTGFTATTRDDGVRLEWRSGFEADNLGYILYRYQDGQRTRVTPSLIAGSSLIRKHGSELASGFSYGWFDPQGTVGTQYELQAIDLHGDVQTFTPRYAAKSGPNGDPKKARATTLSEISAAGAGDAAQHGWANGATTSAAKKPTAASTQSLTTQQSIAGQQAVKMRVNQTGWYRVTQPQLVANGLDPAANARNLQLYADGVEVPIRLSTNQSTLGSGDTLEFYGVGLDVLTTDTHTYYLISGTRNGFRIPTNQQKGTVQKNEVLAPDFLYTVESKERIDYLPGLLNGDQGNIFGQFIESVPANQTVTLQNIDTNSNAAAQLEVVIQGYTEVAHQIQVQLNGSYVGTINFSGTTNKSTTLPVNAAWLREGANTVTLTATGGNIDFSGVDVMRITYAHTYRADNDSLSFSVGNRSAFVSGFSSAAIRVIDVTNPNAVQELSPKITNSGGSYGFTIQTSGTVQNFVAFVDSLARQPASMVKNQPSTWNASTNAADLVIVTHSDFRSNADTLAGARRAQGLKVSVVDVEDIYDEFGFGAHTPQAVKDFLAWSNTHWATGPKYALLFGDSSWDPRNFMGQGFSDYVPTKQVDTSELETASDDWLADFNGDGIPEIALGRLPARTTADASTMVAKILNYDQERAGGAPLRGALLVSDRGFESQTAQVQSYLAPLTTVQTLNRSAIGNDSLMRTQIVDAIDQGPAIVNYFGHGSVTVWTGAGLLNEANASTLTNGNRPSLFVMMTCLNGYASDAYIDSLAEIVLKNPQGGAFAVWASSGITEPVGQAQMNVQLYQFLLGNQPMTLGDAVRQAKLATSDMDVRRTWILLGDPSMRFK